VPIIVLEEKSPDEEEEGERMLRGVIGVESRLVGGGVIVFFGRCWWKGCCERVFWGCESSEGGESSKEEEEGGSVRIALEMKDEGRRKKEGVYKRGEEST